MIFSGGFGSWRAQVGNHHATIRLNRFGTLTRYQVWVDGGAPRGQFSSYQEAKRVAESILRRISAEGAEKRGN